MIHIAGSARRSFIFPADLPTAWAFYSDFARIADYLPHVHMAKAFGPQQFRMMYYTVELGVYRVKIYCDIAVRLESKTHTLRVVPLDEHPPVKAAMTVNALTAQGAYSSCSVFREEGRHTRVDYSLELKATLPKPLGLNFMPDGVLDRIARNITRWRIQEIADGFVKRSIAAHTAKGKSKRKK